jgi:hypothetical protein
MRTRPGKSRQLLTRCAVGLLILACAVMLAACSDDEKDPITVRIFSYYADFSVTYVVNGGTAGSIPAGTDEGMLFYGEFTVQDVDQIEVDVTAPGTADYLEIRIYRDGVKVKEAVASSATALSITYTYDEEDVSEG